MRGDETSPDSGDPAADQQEIAKPVEDMLSHKNPPKIYKMKSALLVDDVPAYDGVLDFALHLPAGKGGVPGLGGELLRVDGPLLLGVEDGDVRVAAQAQPPLGGQAEDGGGVASSPATVGFWVSMILSCNTSKDMSSNSFLFIILMRGK